MAKIGTMLLAVALGLGLSVPAQAQEPDASTVVATVGGVDITIGHMIAMVSTLTEEQLQLPARVVFDGVLERLIQQEAISQARPEPDLMTQLLVDNEMRALKASRVVNDMADKIKVSEEEIQEAYNARFSEFTPATEYNASHILVETEEEARAVLAELEGGADFAALAEAKSIGPTGPNGGLLGWFGPGRMVPEFEGAVMALGIGKTSSPVKTKFGWHVIRLNETRDPAKPTLAEMQEELQQEVWRNRLDNEILTMVDVVKTDRVDTTNISPAILGQINLIKQ